MGGYEVLEAVALAPGTHQLPFLLANDEWLVGNWSFVRAGEPGARCLW
jgi:hypothetical protein